ncbi:hypothetical protein DASC09_031530 [Saccharomycopsis crataegensis]|uniref:Uncharacterized protein n=1 Tax=Saccharomycopsis crataegensis TaxID=43959 RepID=A0AAV5QM21_9ASCO|nr:hypothetical protein DASC09_031530 [Saccharomycopsis crataegensis]
METSYVKLLNQTHAYFSDSGQYPVSKRDVTNAVVIGSIFAILIMIFLILCLVTFCWCRYYHFLLVNNRIVIRAKGFRVLDDEEKNIEPFSGSLAEYPSEKIVIKPTDPVDRFNINDIGPQPEDDGDTTYDSFSRTLLFEKLAAERGNQGAELPDIYSNGKIKIGMIVVVVKYIEDKKSALQTSAIEIMLDLKRLISKDYIRIKPSGYTYLQEGDMLRVYDIDPDTKIVKGVLMNNYLEFNTDGIHIRPRPVHFETEDDLLRTAGIDAITSESTIIAALYD